MFREEKALRSVNERVQRDALKEMYERYFSAYNLPKKSCHYDLRKELAINHKKLERAIFFAHTVNPCLISIFVICYWVVGLRAYWAEVETV